MTRRRTIPASHGCMRLPIVDAIPRVRLDPDGRLGRHLLHVADRQAAGTPPSSRGCSCRDHRDLLDLTIRSVSGRFARMRMRIVRFWAHWLGARRVCQDCRSPSRPSFESRRQRSDGSFGVAGRCDDRQHPECDRAHQQERDRRLVHDRLDQQRDHDPAGVARQPDQSGRAGPRRARRAARRSRGSPAVQASMKKPISAAAVAIGGYPLPHCEQHAGSAGHDPAARNSRWSLARADHRRWQHDRADHAGDDRRRRASSRPSRPRSRLA